MHDFKLIAIAAVVIAAILVGEIYIYTYNADDKYSTGALLSDGNLSYSVYSGLCFPDDCKNLFPSEN